MQNFNNMSYYATVQNQALSPFDEALYRQKQPLLDTAMDDEQLMTTSIGIHSSIAQFFHSLALVLKFQKQSTPTASETCPFWSTKYRDDETYRDDENETIMIETITFSHSGTTEDDASKLEWGSNDEQNSMNFRIGAKTMTSVSNNRHQFVGQYLRRQRQIIAISALVFVLVVSIIVVGAFILA